MWRQKPHHQQSVSFSSLRLNKGHLFPQEFPPLSSSQQRKRLTHSLATYKRKSDKLLAEILLSCKSVANGADPAETE